MTDPCWNGYKQLGLKNKKGKQVPNCVPVKEEAISEESKTWRVVGDHGSQAGDHIEKHIVAKTKEAATASFANHVKKHYPLQWKRMGHHNIQAHEVKEEVEQIDELSKDTLSSYVDKAKKDHHRRWMTPADPKHVNKKSFSLKKTYLDSAEYKKGNKKLQNRFNGMNLAKKKLGEEVESQEEYSNRLWEYFYSNIKKK